MDVLDLLKLRTFIVVAKAGSFTQAGVELRYSQSTVSWHIQMLEKEFSALLFHRLPKAVTLTRAGHIALDYALRIVALAEEARTAIHASGTNTSGFPA